MGPIATCLIKHAYPLPGLITEHQDRVVCAVNSPHSTSHPGLQRLNHGVLASLLSGQLGGMGLCLLHHTKLFTTCFFDVQWAKKITSFNGERRQGRHMDPMTADKVLVESLQKQLGLRFRPLLSKADVATRQQLVHFVLGLEPAPQGFEVGEHLLIRPQQPLDMSRFFDPAFVRAHDLYVILLQGLPSIDKNFAARYSSEENKWYYHRKDNVRLTSAASNYAKGVFLTSHVGDDLEYPTFLRQTGSQVVEMLALIDKIGERVHASYLTGESSQASSGSATLAPRAKSKYFAIKMTPKILSEACSPLASPFQSTSREPRPSRAKARAKEKAPEEGGEAEMTEAELEQPVEANVSFLDDHDDIADEEAMIDEETDLKPRRTDYSRPQGLLEDLNALVVQLERQHDKAMRRMLGVPSRAKKGCCFARSQKDRKRSGFSAHRLLISQPPSHADHFSRVCAS